MNSVINELNSNSEFRQVKDELVREAATSRDVYFSEDGNVPLDESAIIKRIELNSNFFNLSGRERDSWTSATGFLWRTLPPSLVLAAEPVARSAGPQTRMMSI